MINIIYKDITTVVERSVIAHGVNCQKAMGSGVALAIKTKWPLIYQRYMQYPSNLGGCEIITVDQGLFVANCYTQQFYGKDGKRYANPGAIQVSLSFAYDFALKNDTALCLPQIGSALGGLDWKTEVLPIIEDLDESYESVTTNLYMWK